jgi:hypothetical protein
MLLYVWLGKQAKNVSSDKFEKGKKVLVLLYNVTPSGRDCKKMCYSLNIKSNWNLAILCRGLG